MNMNTLWSIHPDAQIGEQVSIGPFSFIDKNVTIGEGTWIGPNVTIFEGARIGKHCKIFPGAVVSGIPQDLKFRGEETTAEIGDYSTLREYVTVNRGTAAAGKTVVGKNCLIMAYVHIAHDCILGDHIILANNVNLAGHVEIEDDAILEGLAAVQQFLRIGTHSFIAGGSMVRKSVPPFVKAAREPSSYAGVNSIGLQRRGFSPEQITAIQDVYRVLYVQGNSVSKALEIIEQDLPFSLERDQIVSFVRKADALGIMKGFQRINGSKINEN